MDGYFRKVDGLRPSDIKFPDPVPTIQYDMPIGPIHPSFRERLESEVPFSRHIVKAGSMFREFARNHPANREPRERFERNTPHERMETPAQERYEHQRGRGHMKRTGSPQFTVGTPNFSMGDFLPNGMDFGTGPSFEEMSYGKTKRRGRR